MREKSFILQQKQKGTENINDLKGTEKKKILCGRKHFEVIDTGIKYEVVKELKTLKKI